MAESDAVGATGGNGRQGAAGVGFDRVLAAEERFVEDRRRAAGFRTAEAVPDKAAKTEKGAADKLPPATIGLALSGGGIRSASISLGAIQVLRKHGLFRYFDYISAISGGSYTAALVSSSFYRATGNTAASSRGEDVALDVDLIGTTVQPPRVRALMNDGRYLMRPLEWANRFLSGWLSLLLVVGSALLAACALVAFLWRSMDFHTVRDYLVQLGMGSDLWAAVLPLLVLVVLWAICWTISYFRDGASARGRRAKRILVLLILCAIATIAGLIGNGDIELSDGMQQTASFLKIPLILSIFGGLIPTFFRKQLFRSGLVESSLLEKLVYRYTALAVVLGVPMLLIGYFAQEDVSNFSATRDGRVLWGDVKNFAAFDHWYEDETASLKRKVRQATPVTKSVRSDESGRYEMESMASGPSELTVAELLNDIRLLRLVQAETDTRVQGTAKWRSQKREAVQILDIDDLEDGRPQVQSVKGIVVLSKKPYRFNLVDGANDKASDEYQLESPASQGLRQWMSWKYRSISQRVAVAMGHLWRDDSDDPLGLAVEVGQRLRSQEEAMLHDFNETLLSDSSFALELLPAVDPTEIPWTEAPWNAATESERADIVDALSLQSHQRLSPEEAIEVNRICLEVAHPELVRGRKEIRRSVVIHNDQLHRFLMFLMFAGVFVASAFVVNPNTTSIQRFYQERLAAAYLGGSDEGHNMRLVDLAPRLGAGPLLLVGGAANYRFRPANKDRNPDLETSEQPLESTDRVGQFEFSPLYCGSKDLGYAATDLYCNGSLRLADAVAISGAALNPLYFERWEMLVIMGLLNLRLGQWMPNPSGGAITLKPTFAALLHDIFDLKKRQLTRVTKRRHILLTDGGHFDNTGLQALLERRCRVILLCDSAQDKEFHFDALANVIGRVKGQLGITFHEIECFRELDLARHSDDLKNGRTHFFCCEIRYPTWGPANRTGLLVYFKSSLTGDEPPFVWNHAVEHESFPHDSSVNQSFSPAQFCAYLGLGQHLVESAVAGHNYTVEELDRSRDFKLKEFASLFLADLHETKRERFLDRLLADSASEHVEFDRAARRFNESLRTQRWTDLPNAMAQLKESIANAQALPAYGAILDLLADAIIVLDDVPHPNAASTLKAAAGEFFRVLMIASDPTNKAQAARRTACEIRTRFQRPGQYRSVRPVLREAGQDYTEELIECLISDGDIAQDGFVLEVLCELGERLLQGEALVSARLSQRIREKMFSSNKEVRECAERLLMLLKDKSDARKSRSRTDRGERGGEEESANPK
jgi:hypothetical protein